MTLTYLTAKQDKKYFFQVRNERSGRKHLVGVPHQEACKTQQMSLP